MNRLLITAAIIGLATTTAAAEDRVFQIHTADSGIISSDSRSFKVVESEDRSVIYETVPGFSGVVKLGAPAVVIDHNDDLFQDPFIDPFGTTGGSDD